MSSCSKANRDELSVTPSTTVATVGQTISVTFNSNANASSWTVTPSAAASEQFAITTQKNKLFHFQHCRTIYNWCKNKRYCLRLYPSSIIGFMLEKWRRRQRRLQTRSRFCLSNSYRKIKFTTVSVCYNKNSPALKHGLFYLHKIISCNSFLYAEAAASAILGVPIAAASFTS